MLGAFGTSRQHRRPAINITPLMDVMFLLLIFFMVSSTFKEQLGIDITLPQAATSENQKATPHEIVVDAAGNYRFHDKRVSLADLRTAVSTVVAENPEATLVLRADANADFGPVVRAIDIVKEAGGVRLVIPTKGLESSPDAP